ncbi:receptor-like protein EIX1 [Rosa rugosa]|uniref:receptor-like protein EIX1 n=1 Tax=Rosa rugosa TaxID=74645 RepID=UPI002B405BDB|nr:receptor-like protein EIX1 [Rosa rugosa]
MGHSCASIELVSILILSGVLFFEIIQLGFCSKADVNTRCMEIERNALLKLKESLTDPSDQLSSWVADESDCCKWRGVGCNNITGHVVSLNLCNPYDSFRYSYGNDLVYLDLSMNDYGGLQLPSFIGSLEKLKYLNLSWSSFGGVFPPNLGNLSRLVYLDLKGNNFVENDLRWLPSLSSLKYLNLGLANLTMAAPYWLPIVNMLPSLTELHLPSCYLSVLLATLPYINFTSLSVLNLPGNVFFNSTLPPWLFNLTKLILT